MSFPFYKQLDAMDCGATSLRMVAKFYGKTYSAAILRERCYTSREGVSMLGISDAAESIGFRTMGVKVSFEQLCNDVPLPCIVHWNQQHFAVVYDIKQRRRWWQKLRSGDRTRRTNFNNRENSNNREKDSGGIKISDDILISVADPASGLLKYRKEAFLKSWLSVSEETDSGLKHQGVALILEPTPKFYTEKGEDGKDNKFSFTYLLRYLRPYKRYLIQLLLGMLTGSIISLILPFLTQSVVDTGIGNNDLNIVVVILIAQVMLVLGQTANELIRSWLMLHITTRVSISLISDFLAKLMRLPIAFFDSKKVGDIMQRIGDHSRIQSFLTGSLISIVMAVLTFAIYSVVMGSYKPLILGVFMLGSALYVTWVLLFLRRRRKLDYMRFQESASNQSNIVQLITGMQDIKLNNCEKQKRWEWEEIQARLYKVSIKGLTLQQTQQVGGLFIDQTKNILISFLAASAVISGEMTLGMMMALQYIIGQLNAPISQFIGFVQESQDAKISLERLNEIHSRDDEESEDKGLIRDIPSGRELILRDVVFQYEGPRSPKVLNEINLTIESGKTTAIVGNSGSGKTTLLKMLLGFYEPMEGELLLGDISLNRYSDSQWRSRCASVMQESFIFSDTISGNIGIIDTAPNTKRVRKAAQIANIDEFIETLPLRYNTKIGTEGHGLSTGQKQRILIARAAYKDAEYIMFDEATNSLDANNEKIIMERLQEFFRGKTVIIVAHRLSTVRNADKIIVLDEGRIIEEGTHQELAALQGAYFNLVRNQLELGG